MDQQIRPISLLAILPIIVGGLSVFGWITGYDTFLTIIPNTPPIQPVSAILTIICGFIFLTYGYRNRRTIQRTHCIIGMLIVTLSSQILILKSLNADNLIVSIGNYMGLFHSVTFKPDIVAIVWVCWGILGSIIILLTKCRSRGYVVAGEILTFIALFLAILGFIMSTAKLHLLYSWLNNFSMPVGTSLSIIAICISLSSIWSHTRRYQNYFTGIEDRKIITFSAALLIQSAITAGFICFLTLAKQNELFLKNFLEKHLLLKSVTFRSAVKNEIDEIEEFKKFKELPELFNPKTQTIALQNIKNYLKSQNFHSWQITNINDKILYSEGEFSDDHSGKIGILDETNTSLNFKKNWTITFNIPITDGSKKLGTIKLERVLDVLNEIFWKDRGISPSEERIICTKESKLMFRCFSSINPDTSFSLDISQETTFTQAIRKTYDNELKSVIIADPNNENALIVFMKIPEFNILMMLKLSTDQIYEDILNQFKITLPILLWFIFFSMIMLKWQTTPLIRKVIASEKDAIENARLLTENEAHLRAIVDNIGEAILVVDESYFIESINIAALAMFEYEQEEVIGSHINKLLLLDQNLSDLPHTISNYANDNDWQEIKTFTKSGEEFYAEFHVTEIRVRKKNIFIIIIRNVTQQKLSAERVKQSERLFRSSFDHAPIGMALISRDHELLQVNQSMCQMLGYSEQEIISRHFCDIFAPSEATLCQKDMSELFDTNQYHLEQQTELCHKDGRAVCVNLNLSVLTDLNDAPVYIVAQVQDITERKHFEEKLKTTNEKLIVRYKELEQHNHETALTAEMSSILQSCLSINEALEPIQKYARKLFKNTSGTLYLTHSKLNEMVTKVSWGTPYSKKDIIFTADCWALRRSQLNLVTNFETEICCNHVQPYLDKLESYMCIPLSAQGEIIGLLYFENPHSDLNQLGDSLTSFKRKAVSFADQISLALANISLRETLQHQSIHDALTGLYNRRYLDETLRIEINRAARKESILSVIMLDVDNFKTFNDLHGHEIGDLVLQEISRVIRKVIRASDIPCRMGGEEFVIILPDTPLDVSKKRAEEIRNAISKVSISFSDKDIQGITISAGLACYPEQALHPETLLEAADKALYNAKKAGRNRVVATT